MTNARTKPKAAHTPGEWSWNMNEDGSATLYGGEHPDRVVIADFWRKPLRVEPQDTRFDRDLKAEQVANLDLCSAAPALLEALVTLVEAEPGTMTREMWDDARAAIAKARGES